METCEWVCFCGCIHSIWSVCEPLPVLTSVAFCVWALLWNVKNARFEVRSLWNENATQRSNTTQSNCVYFCLCACALWVVQSRSEFRFCSWLKTKIPPVHRMWVTCISVQHQVLFFYISFLTQVSWFYLTCGFFVFLNWLFSLSSVCFRVARALRSKLLPRSTVADTCWVSHQRQKLNAWWVLTLLAAGRLRWATGNELNPLTASTTACLSSM